MSRQDDTILVESLDRLEGIFFKHIGQQPGNFTPHSLLECLKDQFNDTEFTELGEFLRENLPDQDMLKIVKWMVFHFDIPFPQFQGHEISTRNWVSIFTKDKELLDRVHEETIDKGQEYMANIYAPSVVAARLLSVNPDFADILRSKWWLYKLDICPIESQREQCEACRNALTDSSNFLCFADGGDGCVYVKDCDDYHTREQHDLKLGMLLGGEDEDISHERFAKFAELIRHRSASEFRDISKPGTFLECNFYARVPLFIPHRKKYMTEIFVAFSAPDIQTVVPVLHKIVPCLKLCVALVNGQVFYGVGEFEERLRGVARISHALATTLREAKALAGELSIDTPQKQALKYHLDRLLHIERFAREVVNKRVSHSKHGLSMTTSSGSDFLSAFTKILQELCLILEDQKASDNFKVAKIIRGSSEYLFDRLSDILENVTYLKEYQIQWHPDHLYVLIDGLLSNALKHHAFNMYDIKSHYCNARDFIVLQINLNVETNAVLFTVQNPTHYLHKDFAKAKTLANNLSNCSEVDWVGVSLLHIACDALNFKRPKWDALKTTHLVCFKSCAQVGRIVD
jgi:hypothetical protein